MKLILSGNFRPCYSRGEVLVLTEQLEVTNEIVDGLLWDNTVHPEMGKLKPGTIMVAVEDRGIVGVKCMHEEHASSWWWPHYAVRPADDDEIKKAAGLGLLSAFS